MSLHAVISLIFQIHSQSLILASSTMIFDLHIITLILIQVFEFPLLKFLI